MALSQRLGRPVAGPTVEDNLAIARQGKRLGSEAGKRHGNSAWNVFTGKFNRFPDINEEGVRVIEVLLEGLSIHGHCGRRGRFGHWGWINHVKSKESLFFKVGSRR